MWKNIKVSDFMTECPQTVAPTTSLKEARELMRVGYFRHLPVVESNEIVGVVSDRDVKWAYSVGAKDETEVRTVMTPDPFVVGGGATVAEVLPTIIEHRLGCVIVEPRGVLPFGIFTTTDALRALRFVLEQSESEALGV